MLVWAVDPFESSTGYYFNVACVIQSIANYFRGPVQPVYVSTESKFWIERNRKALIQAVREQIERTGLRGVQEAEIIEQSQFLGVETAYALSNYALNKKAFMIILNTHGRSGISRLMLGSFAESLLVCSSVPVLVVGSQVDNLSGAEAAAPRNVLFATTFLKSSHHVFRELAHVARFYRAKVTVLHSLIEPVDAIFGSSVTLLGGTWMPVKAYFSREVDRLNRRARKWTQWAHQRGVSADSLVWTNGGQVADLIIRVCKEQGANLITVEEKAGPIKAALIGSVTRSVIRSAPCPVLVYRNFRPRSSTRREFQFENKVPA